ncbi:MAG: LiaI-LiaF-like domain-containing protein [Mangrovibacterium sp.]
MERGGNRRFYVGLIFIAVGALLILQQLNIIPWDLADALVSWQMLLVAIGAVSLLNGNRGWGVVLIGIGAFFLFTEYVDIPREIRRLYWPGLLVLVGVALLSRQRSSKAGFQAETGEKAVDNFDDFVIFGGREIFINSQDLKGGRSLSIFGGIEYDLRQSRLSPQGAVIDCTCVFGGTGIKVPLDWNVRNEVTTIFGAFTDKRGDTFLQTTVDPAKTIVIKGLTLFGGVEIKYV